MWIAVVGGSPVNCARGISPICIQIKSAEGLLFLTKSNIYNNSNNNFNIVILIEDEKKPCL